MNKVSTLRRKADRLFQIAFVKDNPYCLICGHPTSCGHHYIPKSRSNNLRYDISNLVPLCRSCHFKHHFAGDPHIVEVILQKRGQEWADDLNERRRIPRRLNITYLKEVIKELT